MRELHSRISDGIHVRLLWHQHDDRVTVAVDDAKTGDAFTIDVREDSTYMTPAPTTPCRADRRATRVATSAPAVYRSEDRTGIIPGNKLSATEANSGQLDAALRRRIRLHATRSLRLGAGRSQIQILSARSQERLAGPARPGPA